MSRWRTRAVAWLLASVMPFHALTALYLDVLGPAHFHVERDDHDHHHDHADVERHHHHPHDPSVVAVDDHGAHESTGAEEEILSGWSSTALAALPAAADAQQVSKRRGDVTPRRETVLQTRFPGRLERPPRISPA